MVDQNQSKSSETRMSAVDVNADATEAARVLDSAGRAGRAPVTILSGFLGSGCAAGSAEGGGATDRRDWATAKQRC